MNVGAARGASALLNLWPLRGASPLAHARALRLSLRRTRNALVLTRALLLNLPLLMAALGGSGRTLGRPLEGALGLRLLWSLIPTSLNIATLGHAFPLVRTIPKVTAFGDVLSLAVMALVAVGIVVSTTCLSTIVMALLVAIYSLIVMALLIIIDAGSRGRLVVALLAVLLLLIMM